MAAVAENIVTSPVGSIVMWATATPPTNWLICDGSAFSGVTYPELAAVLGGTTLPNLTDRFPQGVGAEVVGVTGGTASHTHTQPTHTHTQPTHTHTQPTHTHTMAHTHQVDPPLTVSSSSGSQAVGILSLLSSAAPPNHTHTVDIAAFASGASSAANTGSGGGDNTGASGGDNTSASGGDNTGSSSNVPPYLRLNFIIKAI